MGSFDYAVLDGQQAILALRSYALDQALDTASLKALVGQDYSLRSPYRNIRVGYASPEQALLPARLYEPAQKRAYLEQTARLPEGHSFRADELSGFEARLVYSLPSGLEDQLRSTFAGCRLFHLGTALAEGQRKLGRGAGQGQAVFLHLRGGFVFVSVLDGLNLLFFNAFRYESAKDFVYYALLAYDQCSLNPATQPAYLSGPLLEDSEIYRMAGRYIKQLIFVDPSAYFQFAGPFKEQPGYLHFDLLSLSLL